MISVAIPSREWTSLWPKYGHRGLVYLRTVCVCQIQNVYITDIIFLINTAGIQTYFFCIDYCNIYRIGISSACTVLLACNDPSHIEFAKTLPSAWNKVMTEGSHTFTSSIKDLTCNEIITETVRSRTRRNSITCTDTLNTYFWICKIIDESNVLTTRNYTFKLKNQPINISQKGFKNK